MKYGILRNTVPMINIGDHIMGLAIERIYDEMHIPEEERVDILQTDVHCYDGEYVVLPMTMYLDYSEGYTFPLSRRIIPVFIGIHMLAEMGDLRYMNQYQNFGPFGCRDEATMLSMRKNGLDAYISGCLSMLSVTRRSEACIGDKVFLVDVPNSLYDYIPQNIMNDVEVLSHIFDYSKMKMSEKESQKLGTQLAIERLEYYRQHAKLVVTSRLHCALPCLSMGIPVILVRAEIPQRYQSAFDGRFAGVDKFIKLYTEREFSNINWEPTPVDLEEIKRMQMNLAIQMISNAYNKYSALCDVSYWYENRKKGIYFSGVSNSYLSLKQKQDFLNGRTFEKNLLAYIFGEKLGRLHVVIYGAGDKGKWMYKRYADDFEMCKSVIYVDGDEKKWGKKLNGCAILSPKVLDSYNLEKTKIIIATNTSYDSTAQEIAYYLHNKYSLEDGKEYFMLDRLNLSAKYVMSEFGEVRTYGQDAVWY